MDKLDRLGWAAGTTIVSYGVRVGVRADIAETLARLVETFPPGWKRSTSPAVRRLYSVRAGARRSATTRSYSLVYTGIDRIARTHDFEEALSVFESDLRLYVAERAKRRVFVHAGVVGWQGRAIVIPGRSFSGKSSLVAALVKAGATYYSDEYAVLDPEGKVHPFPLPISLRKPGETAAARFPVEALGGRVGTRPLPIALVAVARYKHKGRWRPNRLSPGRGALELLANTVPARRNPALALATLQQVVSRAPVVKGVRGEASDVAASLLAAVEETA